MILNKSDNLALWHYIMECGECTEGRRLKHDECVADMYIDVTNELVNDESPEDAEVLAPYAGCRLSIHGFTTYNDGFQTYDETIQVLVEEPVVIHTTKWVPVKCLPLDPERKLLDVTVPAMSTAKDIV